MRALRFVQRLIGGVLLLALLLVLAALAYAYTSTRTPTGGTFTLGGLTGPVTVARDRWGIPHIRAQASDADAMFALGFVHAQDRLWQMEFQRRIAQGRLSEVLGKAALDQDRFLRTWGFYRAAQSALPALSPRTRALVRAYTAGVNARIQQGHLPLEFTLLRYKPEAWTDVDSIAWQKLMAFDLGGNWEDELLGEEAVQKLGAGGLNAVLAPYPKGAPTILSAQDLRQAELTGRAPRVSATRLPDATLRELRAQLHAARTLGFGSVPGKGSNDWVVAGSRTQSGKPLLADDPHLGLSAPMLWYLADVQGPNLHVIGATIPGLPGVVIGHNDRVAWGVTNVNPDVQDLYVEPAGAKLSARTEVIRVKGQPDVRLTVQESAHGPIISGVSGGANALSPRVALKWTALLPGDTTYDAFIGLNYARNWPDFTEALRRYVAPSQNFVYADVDGNIGYYAPGKVPIRAGWDGSLPVSGSGAREWRGFIPFERLPHAENPPEAQVVSANNRVVPPGYPFNLANDRNWAEPYRAERILQLLNATAKLTPADFQRIQFDTVSLVWRDAREVLLAAKPGSSLSRAALQKLQGWDGNETLDSVQASIFEAWLARLQTMAEGELGVGTRLTSLATLNQLRTNGALCRDERAEVPNCTAWLTRSLDLATQDLSARLGNDPAKWQYRRLHRSASLHGAFGGVRAIGWIWNRGTPTPGGTNTVNVARPDPGSFAQTHAPSYRQVVDLSNLNKSLFVATLGQSGNPLSPHYADQQPLWARGAYLPMSTDPADWGAVQTLTLQPPAP